MSLRKAISREIVYGFSIFCIVAENNILSKVVKPDFKKDYCVREKGEKSYVVQSSANILLYQLDK